MGKAFARLLIFMGIAAMVASGYLYLHNRAENRIAADCSAEILLDIKKNTETIPSEPSASANSTVISPYIGYLSIPALELELPVADNWNYEKLKQTPCRFSGSLWENNLVVMAHNYDCHFGKLSTLSPGDDVYFADSQGLTVSFQIAAVDILSPSAVKDVTENDYDLTLFTCTYGGHNRLVVFCNKVLQT